MSGVPDNTDEDPQHIKFGTPKPVEEANDPWEDAEDQFFMNCEHYLSNKEARCLYLKSQRESRATSQLEYANQVPPTKVKNSNKKHLTPTLLAFPACFMVLSCIMLSPYTVGMLLKYLGFTWDQGWLLFVPHWVPFFAIWTLLKLYWWPPPDVKRKTRAARLAKGAGHKKLLLAALTIAATKVAATPHLTLQQDRVLYKRVCKARDCHRMLNTARLDLPTLDKVRASLSMLPAQLYHSNDSTLWIVDTGCSHSSTGFQSDFEPDTLEKLEQPRAMDGISGALLTTHRGLIRNEVISDDGEVVTMEYEAYLVPKLDMRLFSPQDFCVQQHEAGNDNFSLRLNWQGTSMHYGSKKVSLPHDHLIRVPMLCAYKDTLKTAKSLVMVCLTNEANQNLSHAQKMLLKWHFKLGHIGFQHLQWIG